MNEHWQTVLVIYSQANGATTQTLSRHQSESEANTYAKLSLNGYSQRHPDVIFDTFILPPREYSI